MRALFPVALALATACGGAPGKRNTPPASTGVEAFVKSLRSDDPKAAYALLSSEVKSQLSFEEFATQWRETERERKDQAEALQEGLKGGPNLGERAKIVYQDGKTVYVLREAGTWRIESAMVSRVHAGRPHDAVKIFADALSRQDYEGVMQILTSRRRDGIDDQVESFVTSLLQHLAGANNTIETIGKDKAELRWDDEGRRYKIILLKEGDEWRIDDIYLRPIPATPDKK